MKVLVDTPVWSFALRRGQSDLSAEQRRSALELAELVQEGRVSLAGPIRQEILSGIRDEAAFIRVRDRLRHFPDEPVLTDDYERAAHFYTACRRRGVAGTPTDLLLCAVAARLNIPIFTPDRDFVRYAKYLTVRLYAPRK